MYPIVVLLFDGLADRAHDVLKGRTANEAARTPNLDRLAAQGSCGVLYALGPGRAPSSEVAHWSMLGYRPDEFPGRAVFEAVGRGQEVSAEHVFAYAALRPAERRDDGLWLTGRPDPDRDAADAQALVEACDGLEVDGLFFTLAHEWRGEAVLRIEGGADERVTDSDAFFRDRHPVLRPLATTPEAERTARAAEEWTRWTMELLAEHEVNARRAAAGLPVFNVITLKWWGRPKPVPTFLERHGLQGTFIGESAFLRGLARTIGLETVAAPESATPAGDLAARLELVERAVARGGHLRLRPPESDRRGRSHEGSARQARGDRVARRRAARGARPRPRDRLRDRRPRDAGDTRRDPFRRPVPFIVAGPGVRADSVRRFGELDCAGGILGQLRGPDMMPVLLNAADRPLFLGSRPTPFDGADGYPGILEPLT